ncbi:MAG: glucosamine inositolphosphorylceramide transferase family protein [Actinomycetota bacterium]
MAPSSTALRRVDVQHLLGDVAKIRCRTERRGKWSEYFGEADLASIKDAKLDFILRFGFGIIRGDILTAARYGIWSYHHDDEERYRGGPPCFWEIYREDPVTGAVLQRLTERLDGGIVLHKGWFQTIAHSYVRNRDQVALGAADWPARVCKDIVNGTAGYLDGPPSRSTAPLDHNPTTRQMAVFLARLVRNFLRAQLRGILQADRWSVGIADRPIETFLGNGQAPRIRWLSEPGGSRYLADPFAVPNGDGLALLAEEYDYGRHRGRITLLQPTEDGDPRSHGDVFRLEGHASYPFVFEHAGMVYCVPETARARRVDLYRATEPPRSWTFVTTLLEGVPALDPTLFRYGDRWWLFFTDRDRGPYTKLCAWFADDIEGPWGPHPQNPLKTDVRSSRPAGTPFVHDGALFRPAQDNSRGYGGAVAINRVLRLTSTEFEEEVVAVVEPDERGPYPAGLHTLAAAGERTLLDGKRRVFVWDRFTHELSARTKRLFARDGARS